MSASVLITGFASVTSAGIQRSLPESGPATPPQLITLWPTPGPRRACLVAPFRVTDVVPGIRARRIDRLAAWALVSGSLAFQSAGLDPAASDLSRTGVVCGSALGCLDRTQEFLAAVAEASAKADPILFPETLTNLVAGHVARHVGARGPNLTVMAGSISGETALVEAAAILAAGAADRILVLAGDCLTRPLYEYYEAAGWLAPSCVSADPPAVTPERYYRVPGEGLVSCLLETEASAAQRHAKVMGRYAGGWVGSLAPNNRIPFGTDGPSLFALPRDHITQEGCLSQASDGFSGMADALRPLAHASHVGIFGGTGLWNVGAALARLGVPDSEVIMATNVDACRGQASIIVVAPEVLPWS